LEGRERERRGEGIPGMGHRIPLDDVLHHDLAMAWRGVAKEGKERGSGARSYCCVAELGGGFLAVARWGGAIRGV
jgi:hypothetical protein